MEISFCDLRAKEVINICDGKKLGNIVDLIFDSHTCKITGIVVPGERTFFSFFKNCPDVFIPFCKIRKIGKDVILVELNPVSASQVSTLEKRENESDDLKQVSTQEEETKVKTQANTEVLENPQQTKE